MATSLIVLTCILWTAAIVSLMWRQILSPALSFLGMFSLSLARTDGYHTVPLNTTILTAWLCMTVVVTLATMMQPAPVRAQTKGTGYITAGALAGMAVGLLGYTVTPAIDILYGIMITATVAGTFFGFLVYSATPDGAPVGIRSGNFFRYLLAKGFPAAITVMQIGVVLVIVLAMHKMM